MKALEVEGVAMVLAIRNYEKRLLERSREVWLSKERRGLAKRGGVKGSAGEMG